MNTLTIEGIKVSPSIEALFETEINTFIQIYNSK